MANGGTGSLWRGMPARAAIILVLDVVGIALSYLFAMLLRFDFAWSQIPPQTFYGYLMILPGTEILVVGTLWLLRLYHSVWSFASVSELERLMVAWLIDMALMPLIALIVNIHMPISYWLIGGILGFLWTTGIRFSYRMARLLARRREKRDTKHVMVVGAGESGRALIREMHVSYQLGMRPVCLIDDSPSKRGRLLEGIPIVGNRNDIRDAAQKYNVDLIVYAIPSATGKQRQEILEICRSTDCEVRTVPGLYQLVDGQVSVSRLREVRLEDLLGRDPIVVDAEEVRSYVAGRTVLVTGGGGSIGSELCRQVARDDPKRLVIFDVYENNAYAIQQELLRAYPDLDLVVLIGSVRDDERVRSVFNKYRPDIVLHAAAHKHVPLMEDSPNEAIKNNVFGTLNCARAAVEFGTSRFVLISTDKAVNPTNVMGASKRLCEMVIQAEDRHARSSGAPTTFSAVRFGNVLGSNGSVVPLFERQIAEGGPVTVTDKRITRYFMTIPEAVSLVLQSACYAEGGEIFVLDMGEPVRIDDMARNLIQLAGLEPDVDIQIEYTGLRPGEKLYEERLMGEEGLRETANPMISVARPLQMDDVAFASQIARLDVACHDEDFDVRPLVAECVPTYKPVLQAGLNK